MSLFILTRSVLEEKQLLGLAGLMQQEAFHQAFVVVELSTQCVSKEVS
jgi:hypothetical protein